MAKESEIIRLSELISSRTSEIHDYLISNNLSEPSLDIDAPSTLPLPPNLTQARAEILVATDELQCLLAGPLRVLNESLGMSANIFAAFQTLDRFNMLSYIKVGEEVSFQKLAQNTGLDISTIRQVMRLLVSNRIFIEPRTDVIAHNGCSKLLIDTPANHGRFTFFCRDMLPLVGKTAEAFEKWPGSEDIEETAHMLAHGGNFWDRIKNDADLSRRFSATMTWLSALPEWDKHFLTDDLDWSDGGVPELMIDLGGLNGEIAAYLLRDYPALKCIVQDLPDVVTEATIPEDLNGRLDFMAHDFFTEQTVRADVYFFRSIFHDWPDKYCRKIIQSLIPALTPGVRIILNEVVLPEPGVVPKYFERAIRDYDMSMRQYFNAKERTISDWKDLFTTSDNRFSFRRLSQSPGSALAVIEFIWEP